MIKEMFVFGKKQRWICFHVRQLQKKIQIDGGREQEIKVKEKKNK